MKRTIRILQANDSDGEVGGTETYFKLLCALLRKKGHGVHVFSYSKEHEIRNKDKFIYKKSSRNKIERIISSYFFNPRIFLRLRKWITQINPSIVHLHQNFKSTISVLLTLNNKVVQTVHGYEITCPTGWLVKNDGRLCQGGFGFKCLSCVSVPRFIFFMIAAPLRSSIVRKRVNMFIAPSKHIQKTLMHNGFKNVVHLPYCISKIYSFKKKSTSTNKNILFVGRLRPEKGTEYLIKALPYIIDRFKSTTLTIIGEGPEEQKLKDIAKNLGILNKTLFVGSIPNDQIQDYYHKADVLAVPSIWCEQYGLVGIEALSCGTPCVGSRIGGIPEWLHHGKSGYLVKHRDSKDLAKKIIKILENPGLAHKFAKYGSRWVRSEHNQEIHIRRLMELYAQL